ncbi:Not1 N-terminal domain, CCR4-Not complex component-domain-containing protein [Colletotrichum phormii]|uniref:General negative regulator of transcription subunit n=1 Tax=Colletotrichum phormii TaxID=359342 RepID=A0AAJ0A1Q0_9PEZI|nr:Not1 N-terminal domain, CCR4-Not complex component-domain-containing protein [Colletotrichum phormii]KAK1654464.1 Not1 N-terminal domain, CCR4-Not complex component-domain-containing protein [Colletotrichum phormii]
MAARKLQQEVDKCFKKVSEGVAEFEAIYEKIEQSNNISQKEKLEDNLKREIKKLQRLRDQIKTWAASNDIKDKSPLLEHRRLIETQMEKFKAVEKAMKTKAYSKEGLASSAKLDPQEQAKAEASDFLNSMVDELEQQIETLEAEAEAIQATMKKGKSQTAKAERMAEIERIIERHKWHQGKLELIRRSLENGGVDTDQVTDLEETIRYYVSDGMNDDFVEDEEMYEELALDEDEGAFGVPADGDKGSSQDAQSIAEEPTPEPEIIKAPPKPKAVAEASASGRRSSSQNKSPLPALATLHMPTIIGNGAAIGPTMKPAVAPARPAEGLKYASAAAAAAASDKIGISPLPPPPGAAPVTANTPGSQSKTSATSSPATTSAHPVAAKEPEPKQPPAPSTTATEPPIANPSASANASTSTTPSAKAVSAPTKAEKRAKKEQAAASASGAAKASQTNGATNGVKPTAEEEESIYHLPSSLQDLVESFEASRKRPAPFNSPSTQRMLQTSQATCPDIMDADVPRTYRPDLRLTSTGVGFPQEPLPLFDDPRLYSRIDPDTLFYVFYYKQGTPQQYLAAKALKDQSWRFHKQYQTWFQRHEEPKNITEEFEQGTYRFFDYESTWMNRRKADFKFAYKFLEDDV